MTFSLAQAKKYVLINFTSLIPQSVVAYAIFGIIQEDSRSTRNKMPLACFIQLLVSVFTFIEYFFFGIKTQLFVLNHFHFIYTFIHLTVLLFSFCLIPFWIFASYIFDIWLEKFIDIERKKVENINK